MKIWNEPENRRAVQTRKGSRRSLENRKADDVCEDTIGLAFVSSCVFSAREGTYNVTQHKRIVIQIDSYPSPLTFCLLRYFRAWFHLWLITATTTGRVSYTVGGAFEVRPTNFELRHTNFCDTWLLSGSKMMMSHLSHAEQPHLQTFRHPGSCFYAYFSIAEHPINESFCPTNFVRKAPRMATTLIVHPVLLIYPTKKHHSDHYINTDFTCYAQSL